MFLHLPQHKLTTTNFYNTVLSNVLGNGARQGVRMYSISATHKLNTNLIDNNTVTNK